MCNLSNEIMKKTKLNIQITEESMDFISEEITEYLMNKNIELIGAILDEKFEKAAKLRDELSLFIMETSTILNQATNIKRNKIYLHFNIQNDFLREELMKQIIKFK